MQDYICKKDKIKKKYLNQFIFKNRQFDYTSFIISTLLHKFKPYI